MPRDDSIIPLPRPIGVVTSTLRPPPSMIAFNQTRWLRGRPFGKEGVCAPMSSVWLRMQATGGGRSFLAFVDSDEGKEEVMWLKEQQIKRPNSYMSEYLAVHGITTLSVEDIPAMRTEQALAAAKSPGYYLYGITSVGSAPPPRSGHAIAVDGFRNVVFDPNLGQFNCASSRVTQDLLFNLVSEYYPEFQFGRSLVYKFLVR